MNRTWKLFFALLIAAALLAVIPLALLRDTDFAGADGAAEEIVQELDPDYEPIAQPSLEPPGGETESSPCWRGADSWAFCWPGGAGRRATPTPWSWWSRPPAAPPCRR